MATNNLLNQPTPNYRRFVDNQVLTDNQLNEVLDYLNHQDRLSRVLLHGVGIVCGLNITLNETDKTIRLTKGVAVTTAGDLLKSDTATYTGFKKFDDANVKYPVFTNGETDTINLWALETDTSPSDVSPLSKFKSKTDIRLTDAVALLYFEDYLDEEKDCSAVDCDTQGQQVISRLRILLVSQTDAQAIAEQDSIFSGLLQKNTELSEQYLGRSYVPRVLLNKGNTKPFSEFRKAYDVSFNSLSEKIGSLGKITIFEESLDSAGIDPAAELKNISSSAINFQYAYDFYRDLSTAYNELRNLLKKNAGLCCPDPDAFPKHVLLGGFNQTGKVLRHRFYPSPSHAKTMVGNMVSYFERILVMIKDFGAETKKKVKITPSRNDGYSLGKRAVPFYYNLEKSENASEFIQKWSDGTDELVPNYYGHSYPEEEFNPLDVCLDGHDFYRIEGHTGSHVMDAHKNIQTIRDSKSLPFDIKQVAIGGFPDEDMIDFDKYRVYFEDLQVVLEAWNEEQQCLIRSASTFLTGFSSKEPGKHTAYPTKATASEANEDISAGDFPGMVLQPIYTPIYFAETATAAPRTKTGTITKKTKPVKENQVLTSFAAAENSFGNLYTNNVKATHSKNDIYVNVLDLIPGIIQNWNNEIVEAAVTIPGQLIGHLKEVEDYKLTDIEEFSDDNLNAYLKSLHDLCQKAKSSSNRLQQLMENENSELKSKIWIEDYFFILNRIISSCCLMEKIKVLYKTILDRKRELLGRLTLHNFISDHPGAEHKAGVDKGGTFVLLYYSKNTALSKTKSMERTGGQRLPGASFPIAEMAGRQPAVTNIEALLSRHEVSDTVLPSNIAGFPGSRTDIGERFRLPLFEDIQHGTVVGDLCLPYICCSDSPPTTFVFPEQLATLRLPTDHVCMEEDGNTNPLTMSVVPAGGTVKAFIQNRELKNVISENENGIFFDPNKVPTDEFRQPIRFEVNGQPVDPVLQIFRKPRARFTVSDDIRFEKRNTVAVINIKNSSEPFDELQFEWDINGIVTNDEHAVEFTHLFQVQPGQAMTVNVSLKAFNGFCEDSHTETIRFTVPELEQPVEPDEPDEPEEPDEPVSNCKEITMRAIGNSHKLIMNEVRTNRNVLGAELIQLFSRVNEMYKVIQENPDDVIAGELDDNMFGMIQSVQFELQNHDALELRRLSTNAQPKQREFIFQVYNQLILLYFYIHACRDGKITVHNQISDIAGSWAAFTKKSISNFPGELKSVLENDPFHEKLGNIESTMGSRFDRNIKKVVSDMMKLLKLFIER